MKWINSLFSWATSLSECQTTGEDRAQYFINYFADGSVCGKVLITALVIALLLNVIYYLLCRSSYSFAKRGYWILVAVITFVVTLFVNQSNILGKYDDNPDKNTGFILSIDNTESEMVSLYEPDEELMYQQREIAELLRDELINRIESLPMQIALVSAFYALIFFFLFSLANKRWSVHAIAIPF